MVSTVSYGPSWSSRTPFGRPGWCVAPGYRNHERPIRYGEQFNLTNSDDNRVKAPRRLDWLAFRPITLRKASDFVQKVPYGHHPRPPTERVVQRTSQPRERTRTRLGKVPCMRNHPCGSHSVVRHPIIYEALRAYTLRLRRLGRSRPGCACADWGEADLKGCACASP